jgi:phosphatidylglycerol:prolipoprotein diacylglycerol transferase
MPTLFTTIGPWTFLTFTLILTLAIALGAAVGLRRLSNPGASADAYLVAALGGIIGARLFHVLLNWDYFAENLHEAANLRLGGLDWHGAVIGGVIGLYAGVWLRNKIGERKGLSAASPYKRLYVPELLDSLTLALPLIGLAGWWGCLASSCGYGLEVDNLADYPAWAVSETGDVFGIAAPRYNAQFFGLIVSASILLVVLILFWRGWLRYRRFWFTLALLSAGMFVIGFFRGDHVVRVAGIRADQVLDLVLSFQFLVVSLIGIHAQRPSYKLKTDD